MTRIRPARLPSVAYRVYELNEPIQPSEYTPTTSAEPQRRSDLDQPPLLEPPAGAVEMRRDRLPDDFDSFLLDHVGVAPVVSRAHSRAVYP